MTDRRLHYGWQLDGCLVWLANFEQIAGDFNLRAIPMVALQIPVLLH